MKSRNETLAHLGIILLIAISIVLFAWHEGERNPVTVGLFLLLGTPVAYLALALVSIGLVVFWTIAANYVVEVRFRKRMKNVGRWISWGEALRRIQDTRGTIIEDSPTIGWNVTRAWFTAEDVLELAPTPPPHDPRERVERAPHPFDAWCFDRYLHEEHGTAVLFSVWKGHRTANRIVRQTAVPVKRIAVWSGVVRHADFVSRMGVNSANHVE